jgi:hypothetical protein
MEIKKGTLLQIKHKRKGNFLAYAKNDFDTESNEFYPVVLAGEKIEGKANGWEGGEEISCRGSLCEISVVANK